jgi:ribonuclease HI
MRVSLFTDGGSRGNPGPSAYGYIICETDKVLEERGVFIGKGTNNEAEYLGLINGLERCLALGANAVDVTMDSELVVRQMQGRYQVKAANLKQLHERAKTLSTRFFSFSIQHSKRCDTKIPEADRLVNQALDAAR